MKLNGVTQHRASSLVWNTVVRIFFKGVLLHFVLISNKKQPMEFINQKQSINPRQDRHLKQIQRFSSMHLLPFRDIPLILSNVNKPPLLVSSKRRGRTMKNLTYLYLLLMIIVIPVVLILVYYNQISYEFLCLLHQRNRCMIDH